MDDELRKRLAVSVKQKREKYGFSLRNAEADSGVSASTLSRIENCQGSFDADNLGKLALWLGISANTLIGNNQEKPTVSHLTKTTPEAIADILMKDKKLSTPDSRRLAELFRVMYQQFLEREEDK